MIFTYKVRGVNEATVTMARALLSHGIKREMNGFQKNTASCCYELPGPLVLEITDPTARQTLIPERKWNKILPMAESLWMVLGSSDLDDLPGHFVKSIYNFSDDGFTWRGCLTGDTRIKLLDGSSPTIRELVERDQFWVYSKTKEGKVVPGLGHSARVTKTVKELMEIELDSGDIIRCTTNHPFMMLDRSYKEASELTEGDSLSPLYLRNSEVYGYPKEYLDVKDDNGHWISVHRRVGEFIQKDIPEENKPQLHHIDLNKRNNSPENLVWLTNKDHRRVHADIGRRMVEERRRTDSAFRELTDAISTENIKKATAAQMAHLEANDEIGLKLRQVRSNNMRKLVEDPLNIERSLKGRVFKVLDILVSKGLPFNKENYEEARSYGTGISYENILRYFPSYEAMQAEWEARVNHKVVSVRRISVPETEVYDITVDDYNNFALDSGVFVHNSYSPRIRAYTGVSNQYVRSISKDLDERRLPLETVTIDQLKYVIDTLSKEPTSRQALITIHDPAKDSLPGLVTKDIPCTRSLHFMIVDGRLNLYVWMRSNDMIRGAGAVNWYNFTLMQQYVAKILGVRLGSYYHVADNFHFYEDTREMVENLAEVDLDTAREYDSFLSNDYEDYIGGLDKLDELAKDIYETEEAFWKLSQAEEVDVNGVTTLLGYVKSKYDDPFFRGWAYAFPLAMKPLRKMVKQWLIDNNESENKMIAQWFFKPEAK